MDVQESELQELYTWVDAIPLSRPKRNIARDFSDGVLLAEVVHHFFPKLVELHNYSAANSTAQKLYNWNTLNTKVFKRMGFVVAKEECEAVVNCDGGAVERVLKLVKTRMAKFQEAGAGGRLSRSGSAGAGGSQPASPVAAAVQQEALQGWAADANGAAVPSGLPAAAPPTDAIAALKLGHAPGSSKLRTAAVHVSASTAPSVEAVLKATVADREQALLELRETNEILETKIRKLEQLVRLKDAKIQTLLQKLQAAGVQ